MINVRSAILYQESPESLVTICLKSIVTEPSNTNFERFTVPQELGELLSNTFRDSALINNLGGSECNDFFAPLKCKYVPLKLINLSSLPIRARTFEELSKKYGDTVEDINISGCFFLNDMTSRSLRETFERYQNLNSLSLGDTISKIIYKKYNDQDNWNPDSPTIIPHLKLKKLVANGIHPNPSADQALIDKHLSEILLPSMAETLTYLDLSTCNIGDGSVLKQFKFLETLILYNSQLYYPKIIWTICRLTNIRSLDLSKQYQESIDSYVDSGVEQEQNFLHNLVKRLPRLTSLDISCTDLVGRKDRHISAFDSRIDNPFEFLGLFHTTNDAAYRSSLPAKIIAGEANESQILNACQAYMDRPDQLSRALSDLYNLYKTITPSETFNDVNRALDIVMPILTRHLTNEQVIVSATAALWCIVKINATTRNFDDTKTRRLITSRLLDAMHFHKNSKAILINGGLILLFLPDIICEYSRVAKISLLMCRDQCPRQRGFGTTLLNSLACQVSGEQKVYIGNQKAIETMMDIINTKIKEHSSDDTLETAWSVLWNITDETPVNCQRFLNYKGLEAFKSCMDIFSDNKEVLRNMMGLLGNVAECKELRAQLMMNDIITRFHFLLSSNIDGIECSYNAGGILAHIISDGEEFWYKRLPNDRLSRSIVLNRMRLVIDSWPINSRRNINYRSFGPIVRLLEPSVAPEAQYWAVFALTNLTRVNPAKYCPMLLPHDGLKMLRNLAENPDLTQPYVHNLARVAVYQYDRFQEEKTLSGLEQCKSVDLEVVKNFRAEADNQGAGSSEMGEVF